MKAAILLLLTLAFVSGCDTGFKKMGPSETGVVFSALPPFLLGGVREKIIKPGEMEFIYPWEEVYRYDTSLQSVAWGGVGQGTNQEEEDYVETRALDGNEVGLAMTIQYQIDPTKVNYIVQNVGVDNESIRRLVIATSRADIRSHMNVLLTRDFFNPTEREKAESQVKGSLKARLGPEGVIIRSVIYNDHRFERRLADGTVDRSYQEQIDRTQAVNQQTQQEEKKINTVKEGKKQEFNEAQAIVNRNLEEVDGFKRQAVLRGNAYLAQKKNEAEEIISLGEGEVEGLKKQIAALAGPGGKALLRLSLAKELVAAKPKFVLMNSTKGNSNGGNVDLNRIDTNELIKQAGIFAAVSEVGKVDSKDQVESVVAPSAETPIKPAITK